jgi:sugar phosphate permease
MAYMSHWYDKNWRWFLLGCLFLATFLNYFDRQTLGIAITPIAEEFGLSNAKEEIYYLHFFSLMQEPTYSLALLPIE